MFHYMSWHATTETERNNGGLMKKKQDKTATSSAGDQHKKHAGGWMLPGLPVPVAADDSHRHSHRSFTPQLSSWERFTAWLRYYYIQTRWDIERRVARKLHRRWGDQA
jgi:hypothetical protein